MTLPVRLVTRSKNQQVTKKAHGLSFTKTAPGGHHSARVRLNLSLREWADLGPADRVFIYDPRDGSTVWEGYTSNPSPTQGDAGEGFDLAALGGMTLASDDRRALIYVDREQAGWVRSPIPIDIQPQSARTDWSTNPITNAPGMMLGFQSGQPLGTGMVAEMLYDLGATDMEVGAVQSLYQSGTSDAGYQPTVFWNGSGGAGGASLGPMDPVAATVTLFAGDATLPTGVKAIGFNATRVGAATNVADDDHWTHFGYPAVCGRRLTQTGTFVAAGITGMVSAVAVKPHQVVADLVGRMLNQVHGPSAFIDTTSTTDIDQLAYRQPTTAAKVLDDLLAHEPDYLWEILESTTAGHRFAWRQWPTTVRYEVPARDWSARGGDATLANRLAVSWTEGERTTRSITVTADVPELGSRIVHAEPVTLPAGRGSEANAQRIGAELLTARADPPLAGSAVVRRPIVDRLTGQRVAPWRIEPGYLVRVRETGEVLRLTEMTYDDDSQAATLTLGEPSLTDDQRIARLAAV